LSEAYGRGLQKLQRQFSPVSPHEIGIGELLGKSEAIAIANIRFAETVSGALRDAMTVTAREHDKSRRAILLEIRNLRAEWKKTLLNYEKSKKSRDAAVKAAEDARVAFEKANNDMHVTKAYVERTREDYAAKARRTLLCREEYIQIATTIKTQQHRHYAVDLPAMFDRLQRVEECRLERLRGHLVEFGASLIGKLNEEIDQTKIMAGQWEKLEIASILQRFIDSTSRRALFEYPETISIDEFESPLIRSDTRLSRPASFSNLSAEGLQSRLEKVEKELSVMERQRDGVKVLHEMYTKQPELADDKARVQTAKEFTEITATFEALSLEVEQIRTRLTKAEGNSVKSANIHTASPILWADDDDDDNEEVGLNGRAITTTTATTTTTITNGLAPLFRAKVLYDYEGNLKNGELSIHKDEILNVYSNSDDWWQAGNATGITGYVPYNYVQRV
jgi:hypothetical protein